MRKEDGRRERWMEEKLEMVKYCGTKRKENVYERESERGISLDFG